MASEPALSGLVKEVLELRDKHPHISMDNCFVAWFLRAFISDDENSAVEALKGGCKDKGVDALYIDHDARIVFVLQAKYRQKTGKTEKRSDLLALADLGRALLLPERYTYESLLDGADPVVKAALEKARQLVHRRHYRLTLQFVTTAKVSNTHKREATQRVEDWDAASFEVYAGRDLGRLMQDYIEGASPPVPIVSLPIFDKQPIDRFDRSTGISSWVFTMQGNDMGKLYKEMGDRLFARNIRGYQGKTEVNKSIAATLRDEPTNFWYYNNGVTIICDESKEITERGRKKLRVTNAQIINGQQTTRILSEKRESRATILAKVIVVPRDTQTAKKTYSHLLNQIVTATNWQNAISQSDLRSNDSEQVWLERELRKIGYQYLRKRQTKSEARRLTANRDMWLVRKDELARFVGACVLDPGELRKGKDRLFEDDIYPRIFGERPAADYPTFYWLGRIVTYYSTGDIRRGYAKWLVMNHIWSQIGSKLTNYVPRENFRKLAESYYAHAPEFRDLSNSIRSIFRIALAFYRANRKTDDAVFDESTFFRRMKLQPEFTKYWNSSNNPKRAEVSNQLERFTERLSRSQQLS